LPLPQGFVQFHGLILILAGYQHPFALAPAGGCQLASQLLHSGQTVLKFMGFKKVKGCIFHLPFSINLRGDEGKKYRATEVAR